MSPADPPPAAGGELDDFLAAFEAARDSHPDPAAFLPPPDHPLYPAVLRELLRVDLEFAWDRGECRRVEHYCDRFPDLAADPVAVRDLAGEEFRLRAAAGEHPDPREYRDRLGVDLGVPAESLPATRRQPQPQPVWPADRAPAVGDTIPPGYELTAELGRGAFGRVFLARETELGGRPVAVKLSAQPDGEQLTLARLQHTNIVPVYAAHRVGRFTAQVMPFVGRTTLADLIGSLREGGTPHSGRGVVSTLADRARSTAGAPAPEAPADGVAEPAPGRSRAGLDALARMTFVEAVLWIGAELADGLAHAHDRGVLHRDIKPANVLFTDDGRPMLLDFNLAGAKPGQLCGTPGYMAPEQLEAAKAGRGVGTVQTDVYALGLVLVELLTGRSPFPGTRGRWEDSLPEMIAARREPLAGVTFPPDVTPGVRAILAKCLAPDPAARYASSADLREDLVRQRTHQPLRFAREGSVRELVRKWARRHPRLSSGGAIAAAALLVIGIMGATLLLVRHELRGLEAVAARGGLREARDFAQSGVRSGPAGEWRDVRAAAVAALAPYRVESDDWMSGRLVTRLSEAERVAVRNDAAEVMFRAAAASAALAAENPGERDALLAAALEWNRRARAAFPGNPPRAFHRQRAEVLGAMGHQTEANAALAEATRAEEPAPDDAALLGFALLEAGRYADAAAKLRAAARTGPQRYSVWMGLAAAEARLGRFAAAVEAYSAAVPLRGASPWPFYHRGVARLELGDHAGAVPDFDRFLELAPDDPDGYLNRGVARLHSGDARGAVADLDRAEKLGAEQGTPRTRVFAVRAEAYRELQQPAEADRDRAAFLRLDPTDAQSWCARGQWKLEADPPDLAGALADCDAALKFDRNCLVALRNKAHALAELGKPADAIPVLDRVLELVPGSVGDRAGRAVLLARVGRAADARREVEGCAGRPADGMALYQLASAALVAGDRAGGLALLRAALRKDAALAVLMPTDPDLTSVHADPAFRELIAAAGVLAREP